MQAHHQPGCAVCADGHKAGMPERIEPGVARQDGQPQRSDGADAAQDKVIQQVNQNVADGFDTINKNIGTSVSSKNFVLALEYPTK